jgi:hypothetical protein
MTPRYSLEANNNSMQERWQSACHNTDHNAIGSYCGLGSISGLDN